MIPKCETIDDVMQSIRRVSCADEQGDWEAFVTVDVTACFGVGDIFTFDAGSVLLVNHDCIPMSGEVCDGDWCGRYELTGMTVRTGRILATYQTSRNGDEQAAYAPGARR